MNDCTKFSKLLLTILLGLVCPFALLVVPEEEDDEES